MENPNDNHKVNPRKRKLQPSEPLDFDIEPLELPTSIISAKTSAVIDESLNASAQKLKISHPPQSSANQDLEKPSQSPTSPRISQAQENTAKSNSKNFKQEL